MLKTLITINIQTLSTNKAIEKYCFRVIVALEVAPSKGTGLPPKTGPVFREQIKELNTSSECATATLFTKQVLPGSAIINV